MWLWGQEMEAYVAEKTRGVRTKAAEGVQAVEDKGGKGWTAAAMPCVELMNSCRTRGRMSARLSGQGRKRFARHQPLEKHDQEREESEPDVEVASGDTPE